MAISKGRTVTSKSPVVRVLDLDSFDVPVDTTSGDATVRGLKIAEWRNRAGSSKYKGVTKLHVERGKYTYWLAQLRYKTNLIFKTTYKDEKAAAVAYDTAVQQYRPDAILNKEIYPEDFE